MNVYELNLDGLVGTTHHHSGLSHGNMASMQYAKQTSNPKAAALQGLAKMRLLHQLGIKQGVLPPQQRPNLHLLYQLGFTGTPLEQIDKAYRQAPDLLSACYSAASMWAANNATVSASLDSRNDKVHFTAANLVTNLHRQQEGDFTRQLFQRLFADPHYFQHHPLIPRSQPTSDEGAANHIRFCQQHHQPGVNLFVYNKRSAHSEFPARQARQASESIARLHQLTESKTVFACQNPLAVAQGVFHNDLVSLSNESLFLFHEEAFENQVQVLEELRHKANFALQFIEVPSAQITIKEALDSYLFNSQLVTIPQTNNMQFIAAIECQLQPKVKAYLEELISNDSNPIGGIHYLDLKESMHNGGGPACLRLRIPLNTTELKAMHQGILITEPLLKQLEAWILKHHRDQILPKDLADPHLFYESFYALDELTRILQLGSIYPFQCE